MVFIRAGVRYSQTSQSLIIFRKISVIQRHKLLNKLLHSFCYYSLILTTSGTGQILVYNPSRRQIYFRTAHLPTRAFVYLLIPHGRKHCRTSYHCFTFTKLVFKRETTSFSLSSHHSLTRSWQALRNLSKIPSRFQVL